jgi:hypothetical protein
MFASIIASLRLTLKVLTLAAKIVAAILVVVSQVGLDEHNAVTA